jgi:acylphosphatase
MEQQKNLMANAAVKLVVSGRVQGVGFRYYIARIASEFDLTGYVRNLFSGEVEICAEGRKEFLEELVKKAKLGPPHAYVDSASVQWLEFKNKYNNFEIR